jgi:hypothetical protein
LKLLLGWSLVHLKVHLSIILVIVARNNNRTHRALRYVRPVEIN